VNICRLSLENEGGLAGRRARFLRLFVPFVLGPGKAQPKYGAWVLARRARIPILVAGCSSFVASPCDKSPQLLAMTQAMTLRPQPPAADLGLVVLLPVLNSGGFIVGCVASGHFGIARNFHGHESIHKMRDDLIDLYQARTPVQTADFNGAQKI